LARLRSGYRPTQAGACITYPLHTGLLPAQSGQAGRGTVERLDPCTMGLKENTSAPEHPARALQSAARCFRTHCIPVSCNLSASASPGKRRMRRAAATHLRESLAVAHSVATLTTELAHMPSVAHVETHLDEQLMERPNCLCLSAGRAPPSLARPMQPPWRRRQWPPCSENIPPSLWGCAGKLWRRPFRLWTPFLQRPRSLRRKIGQAGFHCW